MNPANAGGQLRVVVDTNVFISALLHSDRPIFQIIQLAAAHRYYLLISPAIINEVGKVLRETFGVEERTIVQHLKTLRKAAEEILTPQITLAVIHEDPPDNRILECAVAGRAELIVSGDRHLRRLKVYQGIAVISPTDFLRTLGVVMPTRPRKRPGRKK
jgi:putative PIN family toxin of toxin-antitoxin system